MKTPVHASLIQAYKNCKKNPNYALSFFLNSIDIKPCADAIGAVNSFVLAGDVESVEIDEKNILVIKQIFGRIDESIVEKLLWAAIMLPEI